MSSEFGPFYRICFITIIFGLNFFTLFRFLFRRNPTEIDQTNKISYSIVCVHSTCYGLCLILSNLFLCTWIPYLFSSFLYGTSWPMINLDLHCSIQQSVPFLISTFLLIIFCFQKIYETFSTKRANSLCVFIFFVWILPQTIYLTFSNFSIKENDEYYFMDANSTISNDRLQQGVLFCIDKLDSWHVRQMTWHYVTMVVPLTSIYIICTGAKRFAKTFPGKLLNVNCDCRFDFIIFFCQYTNFTWLLLFRPLLTLSALIRNEIHLRRLETEDILIPSENIDGRSLALDLGSHFVLIFFSILIPFSQHYGILSSPTSRFSYSTTTAAAKPDTFQIKI